MNDANALFSSQWDIDQILLPTPTTVSVPAGTTTVYTFSNSLEPPVFEVSGKPNTDTKWYQPGMNGVLTGINFLLQAYVSGTTIKVITNKAATIRLYVWADRINYGDF